MTVDLYIDELKEPTRSIADYVHHLITHLAPDVKASIKWNIPFYTYHKDFLYINPIKRTKGGVEICFIRGKKYEEGKELLDFKGRKVVGGITVSKLEDIDENGLILLINQALQADEAFKDRTPWK